MAPRQNPGCTVSEIRHQHSIGGPSFASPYAYAVSRLPPGNSTTSRSSVHDTAFPAASIEPRLSSSRRGWFLKRGYSHRPQKQDKNDLNNRMFPTRRKDLVTTQAARFTVGQSSISGRTRARRWSCDGEAAVSRREKGICHVRALARRRDATRRCCATHDRLSTPQRYRPCAR